MKLNGIRIWASEEPQALVIAKTILPLPEQSSPFGGDTSPVEGAGFV